MRRVEGEEIRGSGTPEESGEELRSLAQYVSDVFAVFEDDSTLRYTSPSLERLLGYEPENLVGGVPLELLHPDDVERVVGAFGEARTSAKVFPSAEEVRVRHADGSWRWLEVTSKNLLHDPGMGRVMLVLQDVTERKRAEEKLLESRARFEALFEGSAIGIALVDKEGRLQESNRALQRMLGYGGEELSGMDFGQFTHPDDAVADVKFYKELLAGERDHYQMEKRYIKKDGGLMWGRLTVSLARNEEGSEPWFAVGMVEDITDRKFYEEELKRSQSSLTAAQRIAHVGNWEYSIDEDKARWSDEMFRIFGVAPSEFVPTYKTFLRFVHPSDKPLVRRAVRRVLYGGEHPSFDYRVLRPDGAIRTVHAQYEVLYDRTGKPSRLIGTVHDITERKALEEHLTHQAFHDQLTGLPNRTLFSDRLERALARTERRGGRVTVLYMDLDNFKYVNDSLGHEAGDELLTEVAERLSACVRPEDTVSRLGGDEFTVLLEDAKEAGDAARVAERIKEALRAPFCLDDHELSVSASIGIASGTRGEGPGKLLRKADLAMYEAKSKGKGQHEFFELGMTCYSVRRSKMEDDLRRALEKDEFAVFYQPKMLLEDDAIAGVEALVRWEHPERGLVPPSEFVPLAEETGLMILIGRRVLEEACQQARAWQEHYPNVLRQVSVNLSARQFGDPALVDRVAKVVRETGLESGVLALEVAEDVLTGEAGAAAKMRALERLGVRVAVDDFGKAYSSLLRLRGLPISAINIDRSFTSGLVRESGDAAGMMSALIGLAHALGCEVTAEGVETAEQLARLRELGCDMVQGYYLSGPSSGAEMSKILSDANDRTAE